MSMHVGKNEETSRKEAEIKFIKRMQVFFPRGIICLEMLSDWNSCPGETLKMELAKSFSQSPVAQSNFLKYITSANLSAVDALRILKDAANIFGNVEMCFGDRGTDLNALAASAIRVDVYEMCADGTFAQIFASLRKKYLLTHAQILLFAKQHSNQLREGCATFFAFNSDDKNFVACARYDNKGILNFYRLPFSSPYIWYAGFKRHFVIPHQT